MNPGFFSENSALRRATAMAAVGVILTGALTVTLMAGCGSGSSGSSAAGASVTRSGKATLTITWPQRTTTSPKLIPIGSNSIVVTFLQSGQTIATQTVARPTSGDTTTVSFSSLPLGALTVQVNAYPSTNGTGTAQASAAADVMINASQVTPVSITLASTIDHLTISPASPTTTVGGTVSLSLAAVDVNSNIVLTAPSKITWTSSAPAVATVDATGKVSGVALGTAAITATDTESGKTVTVTVTVGTSTNPTPTPTPVADACSHLSGTAQVVCYANAFYGSQGLTTAQQSKLQLAFTQAAATAWSDQPAPASRNGISLGDDGLTATQQTAFLNVVRAALNSTDPAGYMTYNEIREADDWLSAQLASGGSGSSTYGSDRYDMAFLGTPSTTSVWELQLTGHNAVLNIVYNGGGGVVSATPNFYGVEPNDVTPISGQSGPVAPVKVPIGETAATTTIAPMAARRNALEAVFLNLRNAQVTAALLPATFTDVLYGAGTDAGFVANTIKQGVQIGSIASVSEQATVKTLVTTAINTYVNTLPESQAAPLRNLYESDAALNNTYLAYAMPTGETAPMPTAQGVYYRIDGPNVWIEFVCQNGAVVPNEVSYRSVWRDHKLDYGAQFATLHQ
jgi:hypothetical protein